MCSNWYNNWVTRQHARYEWLRSSYFYFPYLQYALRNGVPSRLFEPCSLPDQPSLDHFLWLFPSIYKSYLPESFGPRVSNLAGPSSGLSWSLVLYFYSGLLTFHLLPPIPPAYPDRPVISLHPWQFVFSYRLYNHLQRVIKDFKMNCTAFDSYVLLGDLDVLNSSSLEDSLYFRAYKKVG